VGLQVGIDNGFDGTLYVKKQGEGTVRVIDAYQKAELREDGIRLAGQRVARLDDGAEVKRIEATGVKWPYTLEKDGNGLESWPVPLPTVPRRTVSQRG